MGDEHKDIKITPNTGESASPKIEVTGGNNATKTITINDDGTISFDSTIAATSGSVANGNANLVTGDAVFDYIALQGYTTNTGDITGVDLTGGTGVTIGSETGTTSGNYSATISIGQAVGTGDSVTFANVTVADDIIHSGDTNNLISFGTDTQSFETGGTARMNISDSGLQIGSGARVTTINTSFSDNNTSLMTSAAIDDRIQSFGYTTNTGDITGVDLTGGTGVTIGSETNTGSGAYSSTISIGQAVGTSDDVTFSTLTLASDLIHSGDTNNKIAFGTDTQSFQTGGTARFNISDSGLQIGSGARVTTIITQSDGIGSNDNETTLPTSAAVKDYVDSNAGGSPGGSDTFIQYNNGGSFGATTLAFDDTAGSEQILLDDTSDVALMKVVQRGTGSSFEVHDQASDSTVFQVSASGATSIGLGAGSGTGSDILFVQGRSSGQIWTASTDGSASAPVFTRRTDLNTGMYFIGGDNIGITTGGTLRVDISDSGLKLGSSGSRVTTILDEDDMSTDSDTALATQQSIKAYVDNNAGGASLANDANNRVVTATGSGGINGEANLTFDGSTLALAGKQTITVADTVSEAFKVTITDTDSDDDSTPFVIDGDGRVGIGTDSPVNEKALTLNGDGSAYEGIAFQFGGSTKFQQSTDGSSFYFDSEINTGNMNFRVKDASGNKRPALGIEGANFSVAIGYNGTSGSSLSPNNTLQVNVGTENGVQDKDDGILLLNSDLSIADGDKIAGIGFATRDGNIPSVTTEAAAAIVAYAAEDHSTGDKGGNLAFLTSAIDDDDDTASTERMRITSEGKVIIGDTPNFTSQHDGLQKFNIQGTDAGMLIEKHDDSASGGPSIQLYRYSASEADGDLIGQVVFRGEGSTGNPSTYMMLRTEILDVTEGSKDGQLIFRGLQANTQTDFMTVGSNGVRNMIGSVVAVSSNTTLTDEQSGSYVYWTGGTLTLPATAIKGQQYTIINNTNGSATPALGTSNSIATNWTSHAAMSDETARTYVAVAANTWIYVG